ncbi:MULTISPECIES: GNAT family N-acetyltransferase [unclassified Polaromonas]|uniref:GNAT family N-acetyltransferase n=1 Tax=unclassified Polaromonas TaxID=2638319 RepID=UPI0013DDE7B4|nr:MULTISPECIES: GNAT family protein [unclassified Polaromonas]
MDSFHTPPPSLRPPTAADYAALATWVIDADSCARWAGPKLPFPFDPQQLPALLAEPGAHSFVLSRGPGEALGFCQFWVREAGVAHLARIILAPSARGQGLAVTLCRLLMDEAARTVGAQAFTLRVYRDNHPALATYEGLGFAVVPDQSDERIFFMRAVR